MKILNNDIYLLLIDEEAETVKYLDYVYRENFNTVSRYINDNPEKLWQGCIKIIAYYPLTKEAKELDLPLLPNPFEGNTDVEKLAQEVYREYPTNPKDRPDWPYNRDIHVHKKRKAFIKGYKAAQSKQLELLKRAIQLASDAENIEEVEEEIIQSLSTKQLPKEFVLGEGDAIEEQIKNGYYE